MKNKIFIRAAAFGLSFAGLCSVAGAGLGLEPESTSETKASETKQDGKAVEVMEKSIEAMGGAEKLRSVESMKQTGTIRVPMAGLNGTMETWVKSPDMMLTVIELPGMGTTRQGVHGDIAWSIDPMSGPRLLPEGEAKQLKQETDFTSRLNFRKEYPTIEYVGETTFDEKEAHEIRLIDEDGVKSTQYFAVDSGLMIGNKRTIETQMGPTPMTMYMREYEELDGMMQATKMVQKIGPTEIIITVESAEYGDVDESVFELPEPVKALVEAKKEANSDG